MTLPLRIHGGADESGVPRFDFSTNSNACGPCPIVLAAVKQADASHYPDPGYAALRAQLAAFHGVEMQRVLLAGSASEFIFRITAFVAQHGGRLVHLPPHSYGDYAQAAQAWGLTQTPEINCAQLAWACEPSSPMGRAHSRWPVNGTVPVVLDRAYEPLRLTGAPSLNGAQLTQVWQLWTPNKALGLTGVRGAYVIAPVDAQDTVDALNGLCASWPVGAHGLAMLQAWVQADVQAWLAESQQTLRAWKTRQIEMLEAIGWTCLTSDTSFFCALPPDTDGPSTRNELDRTLAGQHEEPSGLQSSLRHMRKSGIKLRDATSFGLPDHVRVSVQAPVAQDALKAAWTSLANRRRLSDEDATAAVWKRGLK
jgi:histidinol-phosphate aminotransferase